MHPMSSMNTISDVVEVIWRHELAFLYIMTRIGAFTVAIPLLGSGGTPPYIKGLFVVAATFALFPVVRYAFPEPAVPMYKLDPWMFVIDMLSEIMIGMAIGLGVRAIFAAVEVGAEVSGMQMGFGLAGAFDPISNQQVSLMRQVHIALAALIFLTVNGHHAVLYALSKSFEWVRPAGFVMKGALVDQIIRMGSDMFILGMRIGAPVIIALILAQMAMGVISRAVPQIQIFLISFPLMIGIGLIVFGLSLSLYTSLLQGQMTRTLELRLVDVLMNVRPTDEPMVAGHTIKDGPAERPASKGAIKPVGHGGLADKGEF